MPLTDADIGTLLHIMKEKGVVVRALQVKMEGLSEESVQLLKQLSPPVVAPPPEEKGAIRSGG